MTRYVNNGSKALTGAQSDKISEAKTSSQRVVLILTNFNAAGGATINVSVGSEAAANKGIQLAAGQSVTWSKDNGYTPPQLEVHAYAAAAGSTIGIYEEIEG